MSNNYDAATAQRAYYPDRTTKQPHRLHANEALLHDLAALGWVDFFEGPGDNPTGLAGYAASKVWLRQTAGVQETPGTIRKWDGVSSTALLASWPEMTRADWAAFFSSNNFPTRASLIVTAVPTGTDYVRTAGYATVGDGGGALYKRVGSEPSHPGKVQDSSGAWFELVDDEARLEAFNAKWDNATDDTAAVQDAVDWSCATGGTLLVSAGIGRIGTITIGAAGSYATARFRGLGYYGHYTDNTPTATDGSIFYLIAETNDDMFVIPASDASDIGPAPPIFDNLWLYGNKANQSSGTSRGVHCVNHTLTSNKQRSMFGNRLRVSHFRHHGIYGGFNRNAGILNQFLISDCGSSGSTTGHGLLLSSASDWRTLNGDIGVCTGSSLFATECATCIFTNTNAYSSNVGITLSGGINNFVWIGGSIDRNETDNLAIDGSTFVGSPTFIGAHFFNGSNAANDTDSDIKVTDLAKDILFIGCVFNSNTGNKPKYIVEFSGTHTALVYLVGCSIESGAYVTALTNDDRWLRQTPDQGGALTAFVSTATNNAPVYPVRVRADTDSGVSAAAGFGGGVAFDLETAPNNFERAATLAAVLSDVTGTAEKCDLILSLMSGGTLAERFRISSSGSIGMGGASFGGGQLVAFLANAATVPTSDPTGGGILFVEAGALKYRGSSGTVSTIAPA